MGPTPWMSQAEGPGNRVRMDLGLTFRNELPEISSERDEAGFSPRHLEVRGGDSDCL